MAKLTYEQIEHLFKRHLDGIPVYKLATEAGVHTATLCRNFKRYFNYQQHSTNYLTAVVNQYLKSPRFSKYRSEIKNWYAQNRDLIIREGQLCDRPAYTDFKLDQKMLVENRKLISASLLTNQNQYELNYEEILHQLSRLA